MSLPANLELANTRAVHCERHGARDQPASVAHVLDVANRADSLLDPPPLERYALAVEQELDTDANGP